MNLVTSRTITALRFPLMACVVLQHTYIINRPIGGHVYVPSGKYPYFDLFEHVVRGELANFAVPLFFFISGYLFFNGGKDFTVEVYKDKIRKRVHSLLIPFLFWNMAFMLYVAAIHVLAHGLLTSKRSFLEMSPSEILNCFWDMNQGLIPLWFIRDLMIVCLITPLIYYLLHHRFSKFILFSIFVLYLSSYFHYLPGVGLRSSFPFILGAWFSINGRDFVMDIRKYVMPLTLATLVCVMIDTYLWSQHISVFAFNRFTQICGVLTIPVWVSYLVERRRTEVGSVLAGSSFFVFVFHMFIIYIPAKLWVYVLPVNGWTAGIALIAIPLIVCFACSGIYLMLKRLMPRFTGFIIGER